MPINKLAHIKIHSEKDEYCGVLYVWLIWKGKFN